MNYNIQTENNKNIKVKLLLSGFLSNFFEFYDFALFGAFAVPLSKAFFPDQDNEFSSILNSLSVFGIAFFARPFGAFFFGYLGDTKGRRYALMLSILLMGVSTFLIGCLPTYKEIGTLAPLLLIICRLLQGFSLGGESNGSFIFLLEHIKNNKGLIGASVLASGTTGIIFATFQGIIFTQQNMPEWAWRIPFWIGLIMGIIGIYIRSYLNETAEFCYNHTSTPFQQLRELLKYFESCFCIIIISGLNSVLVYTLAVYFNIYLHKFVNYSIATSLFYSNIGMVMCLFMLPVMGLISDKITYQKVMRYACLSIFLGAFLIPYFLHMQFFIMAIISLILSISAFNGPTPAFINNLFPPNIRYTGISVGFSLGTALFGSLCPLVFTFLTKYFETVFILTPCFLLISGIGFYSISASLNVRAKLGVKEQQ